MMSEARALKHASATMLPMMDCGLEFHPWSWRCNWKLFASKPSSELGKEAIMLEKCW
jgi:hypothetical protein